jgi:hypothetical protein
MLRSLKDFERYRVNAVDGDVGKVVNFLLDDESWTIRYLVAETGTFFSRRPVLISPTFFRQTEASTRHFHVALTMDKVKHSPSIDADQPVSRQQERDLFRYYGFTPYWGFSTFTGMGPSYYTGPTRPQAPSDTGESGDTHLRSLNELHGYRTQGEDGLIGQVADFIVDDETWAVRYLVIDTSTWRGGTNVLVAPDWATRVSWAERQIHVDLTRQAIKDSPAWNPSAAVNRRYEARLYDYYGRPAYWADVPPSHEVHPPA